MICWTDQDTLGFPVYMIQETLRLRPPVGQIFRQVAKDGVALAGVPLPKGTIVGASAMYTAIDTRYSVRQIALF